MYAVFKAGAHQYKVSQGDKVSIDYIEGKQGDKLTFDKILMLGGTKLTVGAPFVAGAKVEAVITQQMRSPRVYALRYQRRKNSKRLRGHSQPLTVVEISKISG